MATEAETVFAMASRVRNIMFRHANGPIRAEGLTVTQFEVLEALSFHGPLSVGQVREAIFGTPGNVPVVVRNLERDGLIVRRRSEKDGRVSILELTPEGKQRVERVYPQVVASIEHDLAPLTAHEKHEVVRAFRKVADAASVAERN
jgi:MarR family 2-MHQ and catechol resistance regulon transcriptional repressor